VRTIVSILTVVVVVAVADAADSPANSGSDALLRAVPHDHLIAVLIDMTAGRPSDSQDEARSSLIHLATGVFYQLRAGGLLGESGDAGGTAVDILATASVLKRYPHAVVVTDAAARHLASGGHRLDYLEGAITALTGGDNDRITRHIQQILTARTSAEHSRIEARDEFNTTTYTLIDDRLPRWAHIKWAAVGTYYCIALGDGAFERVAGCIIDGDRSVIHDRSFLDRHEALVGGDRLLEWSVDLSAIRDRLRPVMTGRAVRVIDALGLHDVDIGHWAIGRKDRFIVAAAIHVSDGRARFQHIASAPDLADPRYARAIPEDARTYAMVAYRPETAVRRVVEGYLAAQRPRIRSNILAAWASFEKRAGIDVDGALLEPLGDRFVIHTDPPHPLKLPVLCTIMVPLNKSAASYQNHLDILMRQLDYWLAPGHGNSGDAGGGKLFSPRIRRTRQGYWYLQVGLIGPAIGVIDDWLVISHSPTALGHVADSMEEKSATVAAESQP